MTHENEKLNKDLESIDKFYTNNPELNMIPNTQKENRFNCCSKCLDFEEGLSICALPNTCPCHMNTSNSQIVSAKQSHKTCTLDEDGMCEECGVLSQPTTEGECPKFKGEHEFVDSERYPGFNVCIYCEKKVSQYDPELENTQSSPWKGRDNLVPPPESSAWMEEEREAFWKEYAQDFKPNQEILFDNVTNYWLSRIAETREAARKEGQRSQVPITLDLMEDTLKTGREQGRQEKRENTFKLLKKQAERSKKAGCIKERDRIVKMIEENFASFVLADWSGESEVFDEIERLKMQLLTNLKSDE